MLEKTAAHFFCGGGGGYFGARKQNFATLFSLDLDGPACSVHRISCPSLMFEQDIRNWQWKEEHGHPTLVVAGPPCTNFSTMGNRSGIQGKDGNLSLEFVKVLQTIAPLPPFLLIENVPGLLSLNKGHDFSLFVAALDALGYSGVASISDALQYVPQSRKRVYLQCVHRDFLRSPEVDSLSFPSFVEERFNKDKSIGDRMILPTCLNFLVDSLLKRCSSFKSKNLKKFLLDDIKQDSLDTFSYKGLSFALWHDGEILAGCGAFDKQTCSRALESVLDGETLGMVTKCFGGSREFMNHAPTLRGMNYNPSSSYNRPGLGSIRVLLKDKSQRALKPIEAERLMGWPENSTKYGLKKNGTIVELSNTERLTMLVKGMVPDVISQMCQPFSFLIDKINGEEHLSSVLWDIPVESSIFLDNTIAEKTKKPVSSFIEASYGTAIQGELNICLQSCGTESIKVTRSKLDRGSKTLVLESPKQMTLENIGGWVLTSPSDKKEGVSSPFKWTGGKGWALEIMKQAYQSAGGNRRWFDPFCGSLALPLGIGVKKAYLGDRTWGLVNFWKALQQDNFLLPSIVGSKEEYTEFFDFYNECKKTFEINLRAAYAFYFLNRMGYHGMCRHNSEGKFNISYGNYKNPILTFDVLAVQSVIKSWDFFHQDFADSFKDYDENDFVVLDPPYFKTFTSYTPEGFKKEDQVRLTEFLKGVRSPVVAFNSAEEEIMEYYKNLGFEVTIQEVRHKLGAGKSKPMKYEMLAYKNIDILLKRS